uniref:Uncharacterized protein n=1 Tax=Lotus japonicus TaxID=34305 RepID=I3TAS5_LOTJA|nr:unknown [Lotus japonicus]
MREVHLLCLTWEGHLVSNNFVRSSILLKLAFLQLDPLRGGSSRVLVLKNSSLLPSCL